MASRPSSAIGAAAPPSDWRADRVGFTTSRVGAAAVAACGAFAIVTTAHAALGLPPTPAPAPSAPPPPGLPSVLARGVAFHVAWNGPRLGLYDPVQAALRDEGGALQHAPPWAARAAAAASAALVGAALGTPVQLLTHGGLGGPRVLAAATRASMVRTAIISLAQLPTYDAGKGALAAAGVAPDGSWAQRVPAAVAASATVVACVHPWDRVVAAAGAAGTGLAGGAAALLRGGGLAALAAGAGAHYARLGVHIVLTTLSLEALKPLAAGWALGWRGRGRPCDAMV